MGHDLEDAVIATQTDMGVNGLCANSGHFGQCIKLSMSCRRRWAQVLALGSLDIAQSVPLHFTFGRLII